MTFGGTGTSLKARITDDPTKILYDYNMDLIARYDFTVQIDGIEPLTEYFWVEYTFGPVGNQFKSYGQYVRRSNNLMSLSADFLTNQMNEYSEFRFALTGIPIQLSQSNRRLVVLEFPTSNWGTTPLIRSHKRYTSPAE
jgi:hypothetical protein